MGSLRCKSGNATRPLGGCATHFISGTIFLHRPIGLMRSFAARIGPDPVERAGDLTATLRALALSRRASPSTIHLLQLPARCMEETFGDLMKGLKGFRCRVLAVTKCRQNVVMVERNYNRRVFKRDLIWLKGILLECLFFSQLLPEPYCSVS